MLDPKSIFSVFRLVMSPEGKVVHRLSGKYVQNGNDFHCLEDHFGDLKHLQDGPLTGLGSKILNSLNNSMYTKVVNHGDWMEGHYPELINDMPSPLNSDAPPSPRVDDKGRTGRFYLDTKDGNPHKLLFARGNVVLLDGKHLDPEAVIKLHENLESGAHSVHYLPEELELQKMEGLTKAISEDLSGALGQLRAAVKAGHVHPHALKAINNELFKDSMVNSVGNKKAYKDFLSRPRKGVHVGLDMNGMKGINDTYGHGAGDQAIKAFGGAVRSALDESVGRKSAKAFRVGGDEFNIHVPSHEHAAKFARKLKEKLEAIPPVGGTHNLSASLGFGESPELADKALYHAKSAKNAAGYKPGQAQTHAHSLIPGNEGPVGTTPPQIGLTPP